MQAGATPWQGRAWVAAIRPSAAGQPASPACHLLPASSYSKAQGHRSAEGLLSRSVTLKYPCWPLQTPFLLGAVQKPLASADRGRLRMRTAGGLRKLWDGLNLTKEVGIVW